MMLTGLPRLEEDTSHKGSRKESGENGKKKLVKRQAKKNPLAENGKKYTK